MLPGAHSDTDRTPAQALHDSEDSGDRPRRLQRGERRAVKGLATDRGGRGEPPGGEQLDRFPASPAGTELSAASRTSSVPAKP